MDDELRDRIDDDREDGESRSEWLKDAAQKKLESEHETFEDLEERIEDLENWKNETMDGIIGNLLLVDRWQTLKSELEFEPVDESALEYTPSSEDGGE